MDDVTSKLEYEVGDIGCLVKPCFVAISVDLRADKLGRVVLARNLVKVLLKVRV